MSIARIDAKDIADRQIVVRLLDDRNLVSRAHLALDDDAQVASGPHCLAEPAWKRLVVHPHSKPPAGDPRLGNLEDCSPDLPVLSTQGVVDLDPFRSEVLAELSVRERTADLPFPPAFVLDRIRVNRLVESAMCLAIRLAVAFQVDAASRDPPGHRRFPDRALGGMTAILEPAYPTDVDRENLSGVSRHGGSAARAPASVVYYAAVLFAERLRPMAHASGSTSRQRS